MPGTTDKSDAHLVLSNSEHISANSISERNYSSATEYKFRLTGGSLGGVIVRDGNVYEIYLTPDFNLTLGNFIDRYGVPDHLFMQQTGGHEVCFETQLYYSNQSIMVLLYECEKISGAEHPSVIKGDELVNNIVYFPSTTQSFEEMLHELWHPFEETAQHIATHAEPWDGFRDYQSKSRSGFSGIPRPIN